MHTKLIIELNAFAAEAKLSAETLAGSSPPETTVFAARMLRWAKAMEQAASILKHSTFVEKEIPPFLQKSPEEQNSDRS